jgi:hypothetical protein
MPFADASRGMHSSGHELTLFFDDFEVCTAFVIFGVRVPSSRFERDSQTVAFFVSVLLVNLVLQYVVTSLSRAGSADRVHRAFRAEMESPTTWKVLC